jgi:Fe2+ transport system protein FeoA
MKLSNLKPGKSGIIVSVGGDGALRRHLLDMGLTPKTRVMVRKVAPLGDPVELCLRGYELTIRLDDAEKIELEECGNPYTSYCSSNGSCTQCRRRHRHGTI